VRALPAFSAPPEPSQKERQQHPPEAAECGVFTMSTAQSAGETLVRADAFYPGSRRGPVFRHDAPHRGAVGRPFGRSDANEGDSSTRDWYTIMARHPKEALLINTLRGTLSSPPPGTIFLRELAGSAAAVVSELPRS
jgi:hypothetical protein